MFLETVSKHQIAVKDPTTPKGYDGTCKAQPDDKTQHTWEYVNILKRAATPYLAVRGVLKLFIGKPYPYRMIPECDMSASGLLNA